MTILVLGAGAREHALAATLGDEAGVRHVLCAPGNAGMAAIGRTAWQSISRSPAPSSPWRDRKAWP